MIIIEMNNEVIADEVATDCIDPRMISILYDDKCCGHCKYYDGKGYCSDKTPVTPTHWCKDFKWA